MRFEGGALAGEGGPAQGGDGVQVLPQGGGRVGVGAQFLHLAVDAGAALLGGRLGLGAAGGDVRGHLVALVGEGVREGQRALGLLGERHQFLGVVQLPRGGHDRRGSRTGDGRGHDRHGDDEPVAYVGGAALADGNRRRRRGGGAGGTLRAPRGAVCLSVRRGRVFCTGARIPDSCTRGRGWRSVNWPVGAWALRHAPDCSPAADRASDGEHRVSRAGPHRFPTLPVPVGGGRASSDPPPEGVNPGRELVGKFRRLVRLACAASRLDVCGGRWHYVPPRTAGVPNSLPKAAPDLRRRVESGRTRGGCRPFADAVKGSCRLAGCARNSSRNPDSPTTPTRTSRASDYRPPDRVVHSSCWTV